MFKCLSGMFAAALFLTATPSHSQSAWEGLYGGVQIGYGSYTVELENPNGSFFVTQTRNTLVPGAQLGYNRVRNGLLLGLEADFNGNTGETSGQTAVDLVRMSYETSLDWFATLRARMGVLANADSLIYFTAGAAYGELQQTVTRQAQLPPFNTVSVSSSNRDWGTVLGAGLEHRLSRQMSVKAEYLRVRFNAQSLQSPADPGIGGASDFRLIHSLSIFRIGGNWSF